MPPVMNLGPCYRVPSQQKSSYWCCTDIHDRYTYTVEFYTHLPAWYPSTHSLARKFNIWAVITRWDDITLEFCGVLNIEELYGVGDSKCNILNVDTPFLGYPQHSSIGICRQTFIRIFFWVDWHIQVVDRMYDHPNVENPIVSWILPPCQLQR